MSQSYSAIQQLLGTESEKLLGFNAPKISKEQLYIPGPEFIENVFSESDRPAAVSKS